MGMGIDWLNKIYGSAPTDYQKKEKKSQCSNRGIWIEADWVLKQWARRYYDSIWYI